MSCSGSFVAECCPSPELSLGERAGLMLYNFVSRVSKGSDSLSVPLTSESLPSSASGSASGELLGRESEFCPWEFESFDLPVGDSGLLASGFTTASPCEFELEVSFPFESELSVVLSSGERSSESSLFEPALSEAVSGMLGRD